MRLFDGADAIAIAPLDDDAADECPTEAQQAIPGWLGASYYAPLRQRMIERHAAPAVAWLREQLRPGGNREREIAQCLLALVVAAPDRREAAAGLAGLHLGAALVEALRELGLLDGLEPAARAALLSPVPHRVELPPMATAPMGARDLVRALQRAGWIDPRGDRR